MTLAEQIRALAKQADDFARVFGIVDQGSMGIKAELHAQVLRTMAAEVEGKVSVKPSIWHSEARGCWMGAFPEQVVTGATQDEVRQKLGRDSDDPS